MRARSIFHSLRSLTLLALEPQQVIALRATKIARGDAAAVREVTLMINEKIFEGAVAAGSIMRGTSHDKIIKRYRRRVRANAKRLAR
jgi:hypothetical protein